MANQDVLNYFKIKGQKGELQNYYGNPDFTKSSDKQYDQITLDDLGINIQLVKNELLGINSDLVDPVTGKPWPDSIYTMVLNRAVAEAEKTFDVTILPQREVDRYDYHRADFNAFANIQAYHRPIIHLENLTLYYNNQTILNVPQEWLKIYNRTGQIQVSPSVLMQGLNTTINPTIYPIINSPYGMVPSPYQETEVAPQMLGATYVAGMMPHTGRDGVNYDYMIQPDMVAYIAKLAAIEVLERWGRSILGPGVASYSVSVDGIHTDIGTTQSAEFAASEGEIRNLKEDMSPIEQHLKNYYGQPEVGILG